MTATTIDLTNVEITSVISNCFQHQNLTEIQRRIVSKLMKGGPVFYRNTFPVIGYFQRVPHIADIHDMPAYIEEIKHTFKSWSTTTYAIVDLIYQDNYVTKAPTLACDIAWSDDEKILLELSDLASRNEYISNARNQIMLRIDMAASERMGYIIARR